MNLAWLDPPDLKAATSIQREIAAHVEAEDRFRPLQTVAGCDTSMKWRDSRGPIHAAIAPLRLSDNVPPAPATATLIPPFPYVSGYLGFREAPALLAAWERLADKPDMLVVDGQGRAHPRRCGIASHLGVLLDLPAIGVAKSLLCGALEQPLPEEPGATRAVIDRGEIVAQALRTRRGARPIFVSVGHRVSLATAVDLILRLCQGRRQPLPIRLAHEAANAVRRQQD